MGKISERQAESYKIWAMAVLLTGTCILLYYFHVILRIGTIITHIFYVPIILASIWWKRKGLLVALFSSGLLIYSHVFLRPDVATYNDYVRAFMFIAIAFVVAQLSRRFAKEHEVLQAANQQLSADEQQLRAANQQLSADEQQLRASTQQLRANEQQLHSEITERKKAEERIREQREFLRKTIESLSYPFYVIDANDKTVKMANSTAWQGKLPEKITCYMLSHKQNKPCDEPDHPCPLEDIKKTKQPVIVEHIHYDKDGNPRNVEVHCYPIFDNEQNVTQIIEYCLDITERKEVEEALRKERDRAQKYLDVAGVMLVAIDVEERVGLINKKGCEILGYEEEYVIGKNWFDNFLPERVRKEVKAVFEKIVAGKLEPVEYFENPILTKDGDERLIAWHNTILRAEQGDIIGTLSSGEDITERKRAEEALQKSQSLLNETGKMAKVGGWEFDVETLEQVWTEEVYRVHEVDSHYKPTVEAGISFYAPESRPIIANAVQKAIDNGEPFDVELQFITAKGNHRWVHAIGKAHQQGGKTIKVSGTFQDITKRKRAEEALRVANQQLIASEHQLRASNQQLMSSEQQLKASNQQLIASKEEIQSLANFPSENSNPVLRVAKDGIVVYSNEAGMSLLTAWGTQMGRRLPDKWRKFTAVVFASGSSKETECEYGDSVLSLTFTPVVDLGYINIYGLDITERKKALAWQEAIFEGSRDAVFVTDANSRFVIVNHAACELTGYSKQEFLRMRIPDLHEEEDLVAYNLFHERIMAGEEIVSEARILRKDGTKVDTEFNNRCINISDTAYMHTVARDITERKKAEEALQLERDNFINILDSMEDGIYIVDRNYDIQYVNPVLKKDFGPYEGRKCYDYFHDRKEICPWCKNEEVFAGKTIRWEWYSFKNQRTYDLIGTPLRNPDGSISKLEIFRDITEHKQAEEALRESELKFKTIFENAGGAIFIADNKTGEILECNSQAEQLLGRPRAEIIGMHQSELHPKGEEEKYKEKFAHHVQKGHIVDFEGEVQHKDGTRIPVWIAAQCLKIGGKDVIIGLFMDTTKRKKAEEKLIENRAKLKSLASQLSLIEERERRRLATYLHDQIGQSLAMSKMKLDSLRQSVSSGKSADVMGEVSDFLGQIIQDTRTLTFDLSSPILYELGFKAAVAEWLEEQIQEKYAIKTEFEDDGQPKPLDDDIRVLLFRNVRELLINVVRHANAKNVKVSIWKMDKNICVSVEDDGVGFDVTEVESMVTKKAKFGLFSIHERLESLGGRFEIESEAGQGSKITMTAPLKYEKTTNGAQV